MNKKSVGGKTGSIPVRAPKKSMARSSIGKTPPRLSSSSASNSHRATDTPSARQARTADGCSILVEDKGLLTHVQVTMADGKTIATSTRRDPAVVAEELKRKYRHEPQASTPARKARTKKVVEETGLQPSRDQAPPARRRKAPRKKSSVARKK